MDGTDSSFDNIFISMDIKENLVDGTDEENR